MIFKRWFDFYIPKESFTHVIYLSLREDSWFRHAVDRLLLWFLWQSTREYYTVLKIFTFLIDVITILFNSTFSEDEFIYLMNYFTPLHFYVLNFIFSTFRSLLSSLHYFTVKSFSYLTNALLNPFGMWCILGIYNPKH